MTIPHFADQQNTVFVPALIALLVATVLICLPIVFAPGLRRRRRGGRALIVVAGALAAVALVVAGWQAGIGVRTLQQEREQLRADVQARYGLELDSGEANELVNGGAPLRLLPQQAEQLGLATPEKRHSLRLKATEPDADTYDLTFAGKAWPGAAAG